MRHARILYAGPGISGVLTSLEHLDPDAFELTALGHAIELDWPRRDPHWTLSIKVATSLFGSIGREPKDPAAATDLEWIRHADGAVYVADSQRLERSWRRLDLLARCLTATGRVPESLALVVQANKRDLDSIASLEQMRAEITWPNAELVPSIAIIGEGVETALNCLLARIAKLQPDTP